MSMPTTYFYMSASSTDGKSHTVAMYSDISTQWAAASEFLGTEVGAANGTTAFHLFAGIGDAERFSEINQQSPTATAFYSMQLVDGLSWEIGIDSDVRATFAANSTLLLPSIDLGGIGTIDPNLLNSTQ